MEKKNILGDIIIARYYKYIQINYEKNIIKILKCHRFFGWLVLGQVSFLVNKFESNGKIKTKQKSCLLFKDI